MGIAEGTVFRVFPTKEDLIRAAIASYMDPSDLIGQIDAVDRGLPLDQKLSAVVAIIQESAFRVRTFMLAMRGRWHGHDYPPASTTARHPQAGAAAVRPQAGAAAVRPAATTPARPGATFLNSFGVRRPADAPDPRLAGDTHLTHGGPDRGETKEPSPCLGSAAVGHVHHPFAEQAAALVGAIERLLTPDESELIVDVPTAASYIFTTGIASLIVTATLPAASTDTFVDLALRALTTTTEAPRGSQRKETE